jgi:DNA-binding CsgD family transcriptional regulator
MRRTPRRRSNQLPSIPRPRVEGPEVSTAAPAGLRVYRSVAADGSEYAVLVIPHAPAEAMNEAVLTDAEREVVAMVLEGLPNEAIAARRRTHPRTVANQLQAIYRKLGVTSRLELAACVRAPAPTHGDE